MADGPDRRHCPGIGRRFTSGSQPGFILDVQSGAACGVPYEMTDVRPSGTLSQPRVSNLARRLEEVST